jgi:hypothetical protein
MSLELNFADLAATGRNLQVNSSKQGKAPADGFSKIFRLGICPRQSGFQQLARFLLHGAAIAGGANTETPLGVFRELSNCDARHAINDIIDGIDCTMHFCASTKYRVGEFHENIEGAGASRSEKLSCGRLRYFPDGNPLIDMASNCSAELQRPPSASLSGEGSREGRRGLPPALKTFILPNAAPDAAIIR